MASQSEGDEKLRDEPVERRIERRTTTPPIHDVNPPFRLHDLDDDSRGNRDPDGPTPGEIQDGANATIAFFEDATSRRIPKEGVDEEAARILHEYDVSRAGWSESMERNARMALQALFPDVGGSKVYGPL